MQRLVPEETDEVDDLPSMRSLGAKHLGKRDNRIYDNSEKILYTF